MTENEVEKEDWEGQKPSTVAKNINLRYSKIAVENETNK